MAARSLRTIGDPVLRKMAQPVDLAGCAPGALARVVTDLVDTMRVEGGIGIAAPQVGESLRVAVVEIDAASTRYPRMPAFPLTVFINPRVSVLDPAEQGFWEGCLSVPGLRGYVIRPRAVRIDYFDERREPRVLVAEGFLATTLQHELDHLDGILFVDKVRDTTRLATVDNYAKFWLNESDVPTEI